MIRSAIVLPMLASGLASFAALSGSAMTPTPQQRVAELLRESRAALGGPALDRHMVVRFDNTFVQTGLAGTQSQWQEIGGPRFSESYVTAPVEGGDGYDGSVVWNRDGSGLVWVDGGESGRAQEISSAFVGSELLWQPNHGGATVTWGGTKTSNGRDYDALVVTAPGSAVPFELWFDRSTHLPVRTVQTIGGIASISTFEDYRRVAGILMPYKSHSESNGNVADSTVIGTVVNPPDAQQSLRKPASSVHDFSISGGATKTTIPFDLVENHVYLNVMLNGKGPYRFIFDTGGANFVDEEVAKEIGAVGKGSLQASGVGSTTAPVSYAMISSLGVGEATVKDQLFNIAPVRRGFGVSAGAAVDGLIGFEVLSRFITTFDYGNGVVVLALPGTAAPPAGASVVPFVLDGRQPQFPCGIDGIASQCSLDTGARDSISLFGPFLAAHPDVVPKTLTGIGVDGFGVGGAAFGKLGRLGSLRIGSFDLPGIVADITTQTQGAFAQPFIAANVGGNVLKRFSLYLDYGASTMALTPNATYALRDTYERAGLFLLSKDGKKIVYDVRPGTPAQAAGIVKGDVIATIDGMDVAAESLGNVRKLFEGAPGTVLHLGLVAKDGSVKPVTLTLQDFV